MRPNAPARSVTGSLGGEQIEMGFDPNSIAHLMGLLTNLYSDQELACLREYSTNAWDAHVESGNDQAIEVSTPTILDMNLRIRDFGRGLSAESIRTIYSQYGASTKRESDDYNGMMGIGGKSALTYTGQFTIISIHNGRKIGVSVSVKENGVPVMEIVYDIESTEPSGVEVVIPARSGNGFERKAKEFYAFWKSGRVLLNGTDPSIEHSKKVTWLTEDIMMVPKDLYAEESDRIVMGNVSYPITTRLSKAQSYGYRNYMIVAYVPNGAVNFTPSREELMYTALTNKTIENVAKFVDANLLKSLQAKIETLSKNDAIEFAQTWSVFTFTHGGHKVPKGFNGSIIAGEHRRYYMGNVENSANKQTRLGLSTLTDNRNVIIYGFTPSNFTRVHKDKLNQWVKGRNYSTAYIFDDAPSFPDFEYWDQVDRVDWKDIKKFKSSLTPIKKADPVEWHVEYRTSTASHDYDVVREPYTQVKAKGNIYYYCFADTRGYGNVINPTRYASRMAAGDILVRIVPSKQDKFLAAHPGALHWRNGVISGYEDWKKTVTEVQRKALFMRSGKSAMPDLFRLDPNKVVDPELADYIREHANAATVADKVIRAQESWSARMQEVGYYRFTSIVDDSVDKAGDEVEALDKRFASCYPLVRASHPLATYEYIEFVYNKENNK